MDIREENGRYHEETTARRGIPEWNEGMAVGMAGHHVSREPDCRTDDAAQDAELPAQVPGRDRHGNNVEERESDLVSGRIVEGADDGDEDAHPKGQLRAGPGLKRDRQPFDHGTRPVPRERHMPVRAFRMTDRKSTRLNSSHR